MKHLIMVSAFFALSTAFCAESADFFLKQTSDVQFSAGASRAKSEITTVFDPTLNRDVVKVNYVLPPGTKSNKNIGIKFPEISKLQWESIESITLEYQGGLGHCSFLIIDRDGEYFGYKKRYMLGRDKWTSYTAYFTDPDGKSYHNWGGRKKRNGIMDAPLRLASLSITIYPSYIAGQLRKTSPAGIKPTAGELAKGMNPVDILLSSLKIKGVKYDSSKAKKKIAVPSERKTKDVSVQFREIGTIAPLRKGNTGKLKYILTNSNDRENPVKVSASSKLALTPEPEQKYEQTVSLKAGESREIELPFDYSRPGFYHVSLKLSTGKTLRTFVSTWEPIGNDWKDDPETFFGTQMVMDLHHRIFGPHRDQDFKNMRDAGVKLLRFTIRWSAIQPKENGPMNWKIYDAAVKKCREYGIIPYLMISNAPRWTAADKKAAAKAPKFVYACHPDNKLYAQFAATVAKRYRNSTNYFQIWNEPYANQYYWGGTADTYTDMLKQAYTAIKKVHPGAKICSGAAWDEVFFKAKGFYDFWPFHCHSGVENLHPVIARHRKMAEKANSEMSVFWNDETGFAVDPFTEGAEIKKASEICKKAVVTRAEGISNHVWFVYRSSPRSPNNPRDNYPSVDAENRCRPAVAAHNTMVRMIRQSKAEKKFFRPGIGDAVLFKAKDRKVLAFWRSSVQKGQTVTAVFSKPVSGTMYNLFGSELGKVNNVSVFSTAMTEEPQYLVLPPDADMKDISFSSVLDLPYQWTHTAGEKVQNITFQVTNPFKNELNGIMRFSHDGGWTPKKSEVPVKVAPGKTVAYSVEFMASENPGMLVFPRFEFIIPDRNIKIESNLKFVACTSLGTKWQLLADVDKKEAMTNLRIGDVDADMFWQGPDDLSAKIYSKWDSQYLYLKVAVRDNIHYLVHKGIGMFEGDSVQVAFRSSLKTFHSKNQSDYKQFGLGLANDGEKTFAQWKGKFSKTPEFNVVRKNQSTAYEVQIPWAELGVDPKPGAMFELSVLVNDHDGRVRKVLLEWGGGIHGMHSKPMNPMILK